LLFGVSHDEGGAYRIIEDGVSVDCRCLCVFRVEDEECDMIVLLQKRTMPSLSEHETVDCDLKGSFIETCRLRVNFKIKDRKWCKDQHLVALLVPGIYCVVAFKVVCIFVARASRPRSVLKQDFVSHQC
jgi:hypothetical protein